MNKHVIFTGGPRTGKTRALDEIASSYGDQVDIVRVDGNPRHTSPAFIESLAKPVSPDRRTFVFIDDVRSDDARQLEAVKTLFATAEDRVTVYASAESWPGDFGSVDRVKLNPDGTVAATLIAVNEAANLTIRHYRRSPIAA